MLFPFGVFTDSEPSPNVRTVCVQRNTGGNGRVFKTLSSECSDFLLAVFPAGCETPLCVTEPTGQTAGGAREKGMA